MIRDGRTRVNYLASRYAAETRAPVGTTGRKRLQMRKMRGRRYIPDGNVSGGSPSVRGRMCSGDSACDSSTYSTAS